MRWAVVYHPQQLVEGRLVQQPRTIAEDSVAIAVGQGWIVLGRDSDVVTTPVDVNVQSNPRRWCDAGEDV